MEIDYGIQSIKFAPALLSGAFPDFESDEAVSLQLIAIDTFEEDEEDDGAARVEVEDMDSSLLSVDGAKGMRTLKLQSYDMSEKQYAYFPGFTERDGYMTETPGFVLPPQGMQIVTKGIGMYRARLRQWAKVAVKVKRAGSTGKNGVPNLSFDIAIPAVLDETGQPRPGYRDCLIDETGYVFLSSASSLSVPASGDRQQLTVTSLRGGTRVDWTAVSLPAGCVVSVKTGGALTLIFETNESPDELSEQIMLRQNESGKILTIDVTQQTGNPMLTFNGLPLTVDGTPLTFSMLQTLGTDRMKASNFAISGYAEGEIAKSLKEVEALNR